jgi:hypothetical protein
LEVEKLAMEETDDEEEDTIHEELETLRTENAQLKKELYLSKDKSKTMEQEVLRLFDLVNMLKQKIEKMENEKSEKEEKEKKEEKEEKGEKKTENKNEKRNENKIGNMLEKGDETSKKNQEELTDTFAQKVMKYTQRPRRPLARMMDPDVKPQVFHRRYFKVRFSGQAIQDRRQQYSQTWKLLENINIRPLVKQISLIGRSTVELYIAEINLLKVDEKIKAISFDPTQIPPDSTFDLKEATVRRLGRLLAKTDWKNLQNCILRGYQEDIQEKAMIYAKNIAKHMKNHPPNDLQIAIIEEEEHQENKDQKQEDLEQTVNHGKE